LLKTENSTDLLQFALQLGDVSPAEGYNQYVLSTLRARDVILSERGKPDRGISEALGGHVARAAEAVAVFQKHCGTSDEHAIADLICDLGHLADERGFDFLDEVKRGIGHWYAERHVSDRNYLGPDAAVEITITPR
jgi:hypothetical protein